jgi:hypothetical protein
MVGANMSNRSERAEWKHCLPTRGDKHSVQHATNWIQLAVGPCVP